MAINAGNNSTKRGVPLYTLILEDREAEAKKVRGFFEAQIKSVNRRFQRIELTMEEPIVKSTYDEMLTELGKQSVPDFILCDLNLSEIGTGEKVVEEIVKRRYPTDLLLYTQGSVPLKEAYPKIANDHRYGNVFLAGRDVIEGTIESMALRAAVKLSDPEYLRGIILSKTTDVELSLDNCLSTMFKIEEQDIVFFKQGLLRSFDYAIINKFEIIKTFCEKNAIVNENSRIGDLEKILGRLRGINKTRNEVAHGNSSYDGAGGLKVVNRLQHQEKTKGKKNPKNEPKNKEKEISAISRDEIRKHFHDCYQAIQDIEGIDMLLKNRSAKS